MNLSHLAQIADILAALGVIGSLIFVGIQLRRNLHEMHVTNHQVLALRAMEWAENISTNQQVVEIYNKGFTDYEQLSQIEKTRFNMLMMSILIMIEMNHFQLKSGMQKFLEGDPADKFLRRFASQNGFITWWKTDRQFDLGDEIINYIDNLIAR